MSKTCKCGRVLTPGESHQCPSAGRNVSYEDEDGDFFTSLVVAAATDSTTLGLMAGGDLSGAIIGDVLAGDSDGGGAGGDFDGGDAGD